MCVCGGGNGQWWVEGEGQWDEAGGLRGQGPGRAACPYSPDGHLVSFPLSLLLTTVCQILPKGVVAVLGPSSSPASSSIISNICGEKEVSAGPGGGLSTGWQPVPQDGADSSRLEVPSMCHEQHDGHRSCWVQIKGMALCWTRTFIFQVVWMKGTQRRGLTIGF